MFKKQIRIIGWDDAAFSKPSKHPSNQFITLVGAVIRGGDYIDGLLTTKIEVDGLDATEKIIESINNSRHKDQLKIIMTNGVSFGGFNLIDIKEVYKTTKLPVIVIQRKKPDMTEFLKAMNIFSDFKKRKQIVKNAGMIYKCNKIFYQKIGLTKKQAEEIIKLTSVHSNIPEPIRVAHIIATGLSGESKGRA